ncbi:MAG TPA: DUF6370 family protein [Verrucomicrobiae bacterium]|nr:DUF6370 family protein [Verrucomicrobiae bacterium]
MKKMILTFAAGIFLAATAGRALAADPVTITGTMVCGKCTLHITTACQNVVEVAQGTNTVYYFLEMNDVSKAAHDPICDPGSSEKVTVTGTVTEKDGKEVMTPTKIVVLKS